MRQRWRLAKPEDMRDVISRLRPVDVEETVAMTGFTPKEFFDLHGYDGDNTYVIFNSEGVNVAIAGVVPHDENVGQIWMLATPDLENHGIEFLRYTRAFIAEITQGYNLLFNWVYAANEVHIKWLRWCGFTFLKKHEVFGAAGVPFYSFVRIQ